MAEGKTTLNWILVFVALALAFYLLRPLLTAIVFAAVAAIFFLPAHDWLKKKIPENASALIFTIITIVMLGFVIFSGVKLVLSEFSRIYALVAQLDYTKFIPIEFAQTFEDTIRTLLTKVMSYLSSFISQLPHIMLSVFIFFITFFFFLKDGRKVYSWLKKHLPMPVKRKNEIFKELKAYARAFIRVWIIVGIMQAVVAAFGFFIFGLPYYLIAGLLAFILSVIPMIGAYALYAIVGAILILQGNLFAGAGLLIYGFTIAGILDYLLRPYLTGRLSDIHPLIVLLGIFGGLISIGLAGLILGPVILLIVVALLKSTFGKNAAKK